MNPSSHQKSSGDRHAGSDKKTFEGMGEMKDISHIPSILFNEKREEIESIQKNNISNHSINESVKVEKKQL